MRIKPSLKKIIHERDRGICQYCGKKRGVMIIEHVIPYILNGDAVDYNLVVACQKCNTTKKSKVWIPKNINVLRLINPIHVEMIISLSVKKQKTP